MELTTEDYKTVGELLLYREMLRIRLVELELAARYPEQNMRCPCHLSVGQEAPAVAVSAHLETTDRMFSAHRCHAHYLAKGGDLAAMIAEIHGKATGCCKGVGGSMHLTDLSVNFMASTPVVGGTMPLAAGSAFSDQMDGNGRVTTVFFGDAATEEGIWSETLAFAALHKLPLILICENNLYSSQSPLEVRQAQNRNRTSIAEAHGVRSIKADGNCVDSLSDIAQEAVEQARNGLGPTYLDLDTYRWLEHCGPFDDTELGYREADEVAEWKRRCPVNYMREKLGFDESEFIQEIDDEISAAFASAMESPYPEPTTLYDHVYAN